MEERLRIVAPEDYLMHSGITYYDDYLMHYGVAGQKWGRRRYQGGNGSTQVSYSQYVRVPYNEYKFYKKKNA
jgi:hypothetical protein